MITHWIDDLFRFIPPAVNRSSRWSHHMRSISAICAAAAAISLAALPVRADVNTDAARASVAPFYKSLNAAFAPDSADLIRQVTTPEWVSCRGNNDCNTRDQVIAGRHGEARHLVGPGVVRLVPLRVRSGPTPYVLGQLVDHAHARHRPA